MEQFIEKAKKIHKNKYDYSKVNYKNNRTKIEIICPFHGLFSQTPLNHLNGKGCKKCGSERMAVLCRTSNEEFINKASSVHRNKYDYSKINYKNNRIKIEIICPFHGLFSQTPLNHLRYGCKKCSRKIQSSKTIKSLENFKNEVNAIHANKYNYDLSDYIGAHEKVIIICPIHGEFKQTPNSHRKGRGCPACKQGEFNPCIGRPGGSSGYYGLYKTNTFRSLSELCWMKNAEEKNIEFIALDQVPNREKWQVEIIHKDGKKGTYCADFYIKKCNTIIDIKPLWRVKKEEFKLKQAQEIIQKKGYIFEIFDCNQIKIDYKIVKKLYDDKTIIFGKKSEIKFQKNHT